MYIPKRNIVFGMYVCPKGEISFRLCVQKCAKMYMCDIVGNGSDSAVAPVTIFHNSENCTRDAETQQLKQRTIEKKFSLISKRL